MTNGAASAAPLPFGWTGSSLGPSQGSDAFDAGTFTISSTGGGTDYAQGESGRFVATSLAGGDFSLVARVAHFEGTNTPILGVMARAGAGPKVSMAAALYRPNRGGIPEAPGSFAACGRDTTAESLQPWTDTAYFATLQSPCWLKLARLERRFAAYRSSDGQDWSPVNFPSAGLFPASGPIQLGLFVPGGGAC